MLTDVIKPWTNTLPEVDRRCRHGQRTIEAMEARREARAVIKAAREFMKGCGEAVR